MSPEINSAEHLHAALREATLSAHHRIDHHPLLAPLVKPGLTIEHYGYLLQVMDWVHRPLHACLLTRLSKFAPAHDYLPSDRPTWLMEDFAWLGLEAVPAPDALGEWCGPPLSSAAALIGAIYVVEGSTLGGQVISRQLEASIHVGPGSGASFFNGHGPATMTRWDDFWRFAVAVCPAESVDEACVSATGVFNDIERLLDITAQHHEGLSPP